MSNLEPPRSGSHSEPLFTLQVSKRAGWLLAFVLLCVLAFVIVRNRNHQVVQQASAEPAPAQTSPAIASVVPQVVQEAKPAEAATKPVINHTENVQVTPVAMVPVNPPGVTVISEHQMFVHEQPVVATSEVVREVKPVAKGSATNVINGAGTTFPEALYLKWFNEYHLKHPEAEFAYQAIGSGGGIRQLIAGTVDFGASDVPMTDEQLHQADFSVLHVPTVLGAVVPIYNVAGVVELRFTPEILADIYLGKIISWSDGRIAQANPGVSIPNMPIVVVHRSDGSATNFVFTDYLSKVSQEWNDSVGKNTSVKWPTGMAAKGNEGIAGLVRQMDGAIGYVDLIYADQNGLTFGSVKNAAGRFVKASLEGVTEAGASVKDIPTDLRVSITNAPGSRAYPIASCTWLLVPQALENSVKAKDLAGFLRWITFQGQGYAIQLGYAPLPANLQTGILHEIAQIR